MKRYVAGSIDSYDLYIEYMLNRQQGDVPELRTMTIKRQSLTEALQVMFDKIYFGDNDMMDRPLDDFSKEDLIDMLNEVNDSGYADFIFYMENRASGEVFIDHTGPEENY